MRSPWCECGASTPAVSRDGFCYGCERWKEPQPAPRCEARSGTARCVLEAGHAGTHDAGWSFREADATYPSRPTP